MYQYAKIISVLYKGLGHHGFWCLQETLEPTMDTEKYVRETGHSFPDHPDPNNHTETILITTLFDQ